ncbi:hypothetical protein BGAL_0055g00150 [Botrytis galanthina]|uniref:Uncharacterized protein n=1 Tax=Botrytis galanthina TaxID=278940 RepID=A0A4V4HVH1_9HELO|nr:hypothetical protein BGAL_0055g00150 [Botrytis galanthina]
MSGSRRQFKIFSSRKVSNDDLTCPPPYHSTAPTSSQTSVAEPTFDFSNVNTSIDEKSSESSPPSDKSPSDVP